MCLIAYGTVGRDRAGAIAHAGQTAIGDQEAGDPVGAKAEE
jgi:hypothetical protein